MEKKASEIQKERIREIEGKAEELLNSCEVATLTSVNEKGYPRTCLMLKLLTLRIIKRQVSAISRDRTVSH